MRVLKKKVLLGIITAMVLGSTTVAAADTLAASKDGLEIRTDKTTDEEGLTSTAMYISYNGKSAEKTAREDGLTIAMRMMYGGQWYAWTPVDAYSAESEDGSCSYLESFKGEGFQYAVTNAAYPSSPSYPEDLSQAGLNIAITDPIYAEVPQENTEYKAAPYIIDAAPAVTSNFHLENTASTHVTVVYDEALEATGEVSLAVDTSPASLSYTTSNLKWQNSTANGKEICTIEFDLTFDNSYNGQFAVYSFNYNNLVGVHSRKSPNSLKYTTSFYSCSEVYGCDNNNGSASEILHMSPSDYVGHGSIDLDSYQYDPSIFGNFQTNVLLVADNGSGSDIYVLTYNYVESVQKINKGYKAIMAVPYPEGHGSESKYTAYKFMKQSDGSYRGLELPTKITAKGLEVNHNNFVFPEIPKQAEEKEESDTITLEFMTGSSPEEPGEVFASFEVVKNARKEVTLANTIKTIGSLPEKEGKTFDYWREAKIKDESVLGNRIYGVIWTGTNNHRIYAQYK